MFRVSWWPGVSRQTVHPQQNLLIRSQKQLLSQSSNCHTAISGSVWVLLAEQSRAKQSSLAYHLCSETQNIQLNTVSLAIALCTPFFLGSSIWLPFPYSTFPYTSAAKQITTPATGIPFEMQEAIFRQQLKPI